MTSYSTISNATDIEAYAERINGMLAVHNASGQYLVAPDLAWTAPTLINSWANFGSGYANAEYRKDALGWVHIHGLVTSGASAIIFTLPSGYRPAVIERFATSVTGGASGTLAVDTSGNVQLLAGTMTNVTIDCMFRAA
jgi:hypothetical protein